MRNLFFQLFAIAILSCAVSAAAANSTKSTIIIRPDGTAEVKQETVQPRAQMEQEAKMWARIQSAEPDADETFPAIDPKAQQKPFTDQELLAQVREMMEKRNESGDDEEAGKIETLEITTNGVRMVLTHSYTNLEELLASMSWGQNGLAFENTRMEKNSGGKLQMTFTSDPRMKRYVPQMIKGLQAQGQSTEFRVTLPGKVISSSFTNVQDNTTWVMIDPKNKASLDAAAGLYEAPIVIVAELNGLKLDQPLDSKEARRAVRDRDKAGSGLPITDAGPGFVPQAVSVTTSTLYLFPDGQKQFKDGAESLGETGTVVRVKLFAPKGRYLRAVSGATVIRAVDDKGRVVAPAKDESEMMDFDRFSSGSSDDNEKVGPTQMEMQLRLVLPESDAQAIQEISGEAIAVSFGKWKELTATNLQTEIDLSAVLPGAKLKVTKFTAKRQQISAQVEIKGPAAGIRQLDIKLKPAGEEKENSNSSVMERNFKAGGDQSVRNLAIEFYQFGGGRDSAPSTNGLSLVIRYPDELRRERVKFKVNSLDLF